MSEEMDNAFEGEMHHPSDVVKNIFDAKDPKVKSDLSPRQISICARLYFQAEMCGLPELSRVVDEFITLRISKERNSRKEFVEAFKMSNNMNQFGGGMMGGMGPGMMGGGFRR